MSSAYVAQPYRLLYPEAFFSEAFSFYLYLICAFGAIMYLLEPKGGGGWWNEHGPLSPFDSLSIGVTYTVRKMYLILRSIERMLQTQLSMARRFKLQVLRKVF